MKILMIERKMHKIQMKMTKKEVQEEDRKYNVRISEYINR